ncbi:hypothetical protein J3B02_006386 [Coemansia erecta]|uniref:Uncharacterized protein n=1 Tax=Coemansia asiatica TaxID=1052880 RepID=A0A9W7XCY8_9FUNG|nr:hypothetical protein LPJ64_006191 [Coemansia asiatica]KAJ2838017.1 hypothetical protein J3B02_006386 [Coemansia erecta]KAJ2869319.1 hypothetical protein FB639_004770 [Coemansia asiatica]
MSTVAGNVWELSIRELINKRIVTFRHLRNTMALPLELPAEEGSMAVVPEVGQASDGSGSGSGSSKGAKHRAYFNALLFDPDDLRGMFNSIRLRKRTRTYFMLGASLGPILAISNPSDYIKALGILINEYDTFMAESGSKTKKRNFFRKSKGTEEHGSSMMQNGYELGNFSYLDTHLPPFDLDFLQVFDTFCQITVIMYTKLADSLLSIAISQSAFDNIAKIDSRFKKMIGVVTKELDELVKNAVTKELRLIDPLDMASPENEINTDWETGSVYK